MLVFYYYFTHGLTQFILLFTWWYNRGLNQIMNKLADRQLAEIRRLNVWLWLKNLLTPMFHDYTFIGRLLSFVFRLAIIIVRLITLTLNFTINLIVLLFWLALPPAIVMGLLLSI